MSAIIVKMTTYTFSIPTIISNTYCYWHQNRFIEFHDYTFLNGASEGNRTPTDLVHMILNHARLPSYATLAFINQSVQCCCSHDSKLGVKKLPQLPQTIAISGVARVPSNSTTLLALIGSPDFSFLRKKNAVSPHSL